MGKIIGWIVVALVVIAGVWYFINMSSGGAAPAATAPTSQTSAQQAQPTAAQQQAADTSDAGLNQDAASIDTQLQAASADSNSAASFNDTPVQQTE
jgi:hypothetical protein